MNLLEMLFSSMNNQNSVNSMSQKTGVSASQVSKLLILALPSCKNYAQTTLRITKELNGGQQEHRL